MRGRLAQLEAARPGAEAHGAPEAYTRLRREACRLDEVVSQLRALEVCLVEGGRVIALGFSGGPLRGCRCCVWGLPVLFTASDARAVALEGAGGASLNRACSRG